MKHRGKNKKKQWRHCCKNLDKNLETLKNQQKIVADAFTVGTVKKSKPIVKGNLEAAKLYSDIPTVADGRPKFPKFTFKPSVIPSIDLWTEDTGSKSKRQPSIDIPLAGQSYNPSIEDHHAVLQALSVQEMIKDKRRRKEERFIASLRNASKTVEPIEEAKKFLQLLSSDGAKTETLMEQQSDDEDITVPKKKKSKKNNNRMSVDLENIPKLLKELKREDRLRAEKRAKRLERKANRIRLEKQLDQDIAFHMPGELPASLRQLTPEGDLLRDVDKRRNKCPRARRTLGITKNTKEYEKRR